MPRWSRPEVEPVLQPAATEGPFLPEEAAGEVRRSIGAIEVRLEALEEQVRALFTSMASYATIAQRTNDVSRAEARADLDRTQRMLLGLVDQLRRDVDAVGSPVSEPVRSLLG